MSFLLDTDTCSDVLKRPGRLAHRLIQYAGRLAIPTIVLAEWTDWAHHKADPSARLLLIQELLAEIEVIDFDTA